MVDSRHLAVIPRDRDGVPSQRCNTASIGGITAPVDGISVFQEFRFRRCHLNLVGQKGAVELTLRLFLRGVRSNRVRIERARALDLK